MKRLAVPRPILARVPREVEREAVERVRRLVRPGYLLAAFMESIRLSAAAWREVLEAEGRWIEVLGDAVAMFSDRRTLTMSATAIASALTCPLRTALEKRMGLRILRGSTVRALARGALFHSLVEKAIDAPTEVPLVGRDAWGVADALIEARVRGWLVAVVVELKSFSPGSPYASLGKLQAAVYAAIAEERLGIDAAVPILLTPGGAKPLPKLAAGELEKLARFARAALRRPFPRPSRLCNTCPVRSACSKNRHLIYAERSPLVGILI